MFGGKLCNNAVVIDHHHNQIILAFSNTFYLYSFTTGILLNQFTIHDHPILHYQSQPDQSIISVDQQGNINIFSISNNQPQLHHKMHIKTINTIKLAHIHENNVYFIDQTNQFSSFNIKQKKIKYIGVYSRLLGIWGNFLVLLTKEAAKNLVILNLETENVVLKYAHPSPIMCCVVRGSSLIVGDENGKITILEEATLGNLRHQIVLEWHLHSVLTLQESGNFLFSAGQESTVVMWHLKQHTKDFLPRIGTSIKKLYIDNSIIICFMSDNSVKAIDLSQDKKTISYRLIIDPDGFQTVQSQKTQFSTRKFQNISANVRSETICLNGLPGRLQLIAVRSAQVSDIEVVSRNYISRLDDDYPNPYQIKSFAFNGEWSKMVSAVEGINHSSLKFYNLQNGKWKISGKIQRPHVGQTQQCLWVSDSLEDKFVSFSLQDPQVKIWKMYSSRKKSILELDQYYWNCQFQVNYRGKTPLWISCSSNILLVTYENQIVFFDVKARKILFNYTIQNIRKCYLINSQSFTVSAEFIDKLVVIKLKTKKNAPEYEFQYQFTNKLRQIVDKDNIVIQSCKANSEEILLYNVAQKKLTNQWELDQNISGCFWFGKRLLIISANMLFYDLTHNESLFKKEASKVIISQTEEQSTQIKQQNVSLQQLQARWISNRDAKNIKKIQEIFTNAHVYPSMLTTFQTLACQSLI